MIAMIASTAITPIATITRNIEAPLDPVGLAREAPIGLETCDSHLEKRDRADIARCEAPALGAHELPAVDAPAAPRSGDFSELALERDRQELQEPGLRPRAGFPSPRRRQMDAGEGCELLSRSAPVP